MGPEPRAWPCSWPTPHPAPSPMAGPRVPGCWGRPKGEGLDGRLFSQEAQPLMKILIAASL